MVNDRFPKTPVHIDEDAHAEEMDVLLSVREVRDIYPMFEPALCGRVEPWMRIQHRDDELITFAGITVVAKEDDEA